MKFDTTRNKISDSFNKAEESVFEITKKGNTITTSFDGIYQNNQEIIYDSDWIVGVTSGSKISEGESISFSQEADGDVAVRGLEGHNIIDLNIIKTLDLSEEQLARLDYSILIKPIPGAIIKSVIEYDTVRVDQQEISHITGDGDLICYDYTVSGDLRDEWESEFFDLGYLNTDFTTPIGNEYHLFYTSDKTNRVAMDNFDLLNLPTAVPGELPYNQIRVEVNADPNPLTLSLPIKPFDNLLHIDEVPKISKITQEKDSLGRYRYKFIAERKIWYNGPATQLVGDSYVYRNKTYIQNEEETAYIVDVDETEFRSTPTYRFAIPKVEIRVVIFLTSNLKYNMENQLI